MVGLLLASILLLSPAEIDDLLAGHPAGEDGWRQALMEYSGDTLACVEYLLVAATPEDRDSMSLPVLADHVFGALSSRDRWFDTMPDSIFFDYLLQYRISDEPLSAYRSSLDAWLDRRVRMGASAYETAEEIMRVLTSNISLSADGPLLAPTQIIPVGQASRENRWVLMAACMRSVGIPVRPVRGWFPGAETNLYMWLDVWTGEEWRPLTAGMPPVQYVKVAVEYPTMRNVTSEYRDTGILVIFPVTGFSEGWSVDLMIPSGEDTVIVDDIALNPLGRSVVELGTGEFLLGVSYTEGMEVVESWVRTITITSDATAEIDLMEAL